jgi:protein TonB
MASVPSRSPIPDIRYLTPETPVGFSQPSISADGGEKDLRLAARGGEGGSAGGSAGDLPFSPSPALPIGDEELGRGEALEMWQVEDPPKQVRSVDPEYPPMARRMGVEGSVVIRYLVGQDGRVEQMKVLEGPELLREASLHAVGQFVYEPVSDRGRRRKVWMRQVITFRLE